MKRVQRTVKRIFIPVVILLSAGAAQVAVAAEPRGEATDLPKITYPIFDNEITQKDVSDPGNENSGAIRDAGVALKTNLLFDLVGAPNIGAEIPIGGRISATVDLAYAYWRIDNTYALQTTQGSVGAKYWFDQHRGRLTGWSAGVYGMYSTRYDVQWKDGYQGDGFWSAGLSAGYALPIGRRLNLEFSLAAGYFHTPEVRHYHRPVDGHLMWQETRYDVGRVSLTRAQVNLVWLLGGK